MNHMANKIVQIGPNDIDESGVVNVDLSQWNGDIIIEKTNMAIFHQNLNVRNIFSEADSIIALNVHCLNFNTNNAHIHGSLYCESDVRTYDLLIDGECVVCGDLYCNNLSVIGPLQVKGNIKSNGNINFYSLVYIKGKENFAFGRKLNSHTPMIAIDRVVTDPSDQFSGAGRMIAMFFKNSEPMIEMLSPVHENVPFSYFNKEFECGFPYISKYLENVDKTLRGAV